MIGTQTLAQQAHQPHARGGRSAPLSSHPAFTPALTLWSAALLGLPVLAISGASLESWVLAAKIDTILPAAAPPLGGTARLLLALGFALVGACAGWIAARLLRPVPEREGDEIKLRQRDRHPDAPARRPISAHAELGDEGLSGMTGDRDMFPDDLSPYRSEPAPAAYQAPAFSSPFLSEPAPATPVFAASAAPVFAAPDAPVFAAPAFTMAEEAAPAPTSHAGPTPLIEPDAYDLPDIDFDGLSAAPHAPYPSPVEAAAQEAPAPEHPRLTLAPLAEAADDDWHALPPVVSDTDLHRTPARAPVVTAAAVVPITRAVASRPVDKSATPVPPAETPALIGATPVQPRASAGERITHAALGDLSHVELIERLAMAIHTREKGAKPVAVNDAQDSDPVAASRDDMEERTGTQANLRSALAGLREVK